MNSPDLARPLLEVVSLVQQKAVYEIYSYGDTVVVMPLHQVEKANGETSALAKYARISIEEHLQELIQYRCHVEVTGANSIILYIPEHIT